MKDNDAYASFALSFSHSLENVLYELYAPVLTAIAINQSNI